MIVSVGDPEANTPGARFARKNDAHWFGFIQMVDMPDAPRSPMMWLADDTNLTLAVEDGDRELSDDLHQIIQMYLLLFLTQDERDPTAHVVETVASNRTLH